MSKMDGAVMSGTGFAVIAGFLFAIIGMIVGAFIVWNQAPVVGGEWWPYIRIGATAVGAIIAAKVGVLVGYIVGGIGGTILGFVLG